MDVHAVPEVAHCETEVPLASDLDGCLEGHRKKSNKEVGEGKADQEIVVDVAKAAVEDDGDDDEDIVDDGEGDDGEDDDALQDQQGHFQVALSLLAH